MANRTLVRLKIVSATLRPDTIGDLLRMQCDRFWHIGDKRQHTTIVEATNGWILNSGASQDESLEAQVELLLSKLEPHTATLLRIAEDAEIEMSCVIYCDETPPLNFSPSVVARIAGFGGSLDIDLYVG